MLCAHTCYVCVCHCPSCIEAHHQRRTQAPETVQSGDRESIAAELISRRPLCTLPGARRRAALQIAVTAFILYKCPSDQQALWSIMVRGHQPSCSASFALLDKLCLLSCKRPWVCAAAGRCPGFLEGHG